jgi:hypothetical protein
LGNHLPGIQPGMAGVCIVLEHIAGDGEMVDGPKRGWALKFQRQTALETRLARLMIDQVSAASGTLR